MLALADVNQSFRNLDKSRILIDDAVRTATDLLGAEHQTTMYALRYSRRQLYYEGHIHESILATRELVNLRDRVLGPTHPSSVSELQSLINLLDKNGQYKEAHDLSNELVGRAIDSFGHSNSKTQRAIELKKSLSMKMGS